MKNESALGVIMYSALATGAIFCGALGWGITLSILGFLIAFRYGSVVPACIGFVFFVIMYTSGATLWYLPEVAFLGLLIVGLKIRNYTIFV